MQDWIELGGPVVIILLVLAALASVLSISKCLQLLRWQAAIKQQKSGNDAVAALQLAESQKDSELLREEVQRLASNAVRQMKSGLRLVELIAQLAPLLGLFGTVLGMIAAFQQLATVQNDPTLLASGIWQALLTTAVGLAVAIPFTFIHSFLVQWQQRISHGLGDQLSKVFTRKLAVNGEQSSFTKGTPNKASDAA
ncbi:MotA/TolQ/ExbB proton channel family protein [Salinibius halmophilus]|uniref:MotA/TolQ/ExbB proton channel family protein n=1 Tax=Salinibius halmophilus TaxID=1853216 RepID=UPI000E673CDF|nr:MotA/TolQ/ExbB proton channel family protein [Salinibius halmophilus]